MSRKVRGGMKKNWLSEIGKSPEMRKVVVEKTAKVKRLAEQKVKAESSTAKVFQFHYGSTILSGTWGHTGLIWPTTPMARKRDQLLSRAALAENLTRKDRGDD